MEDVRLYLGSVASGGPVLPGPPMPHPSPLRSIPAPGGLAVRFANTVACAACRAADALEAPAAFRAWAARFGLEDSVAPAPGELARLRRFRLDVRDLLASASGRRVPAAGRLATLNTVLARGTFPPALGWAQGRFLLRSVARGRWSARFEVEVARSTLELLTGPTRRRLRACRGRGCAHFLLSRNRTQIWCSAAGCGNRARVARHYWKDRREPPREGGGRGAPRSASGRRPGRSP